MAEGFSVPREGMRDELSCSVCLELYVNPVTLPCSHSLCEECLKRIRNLINNTVDCPLCRRSFEFLDEENVKKNHALRRIVEVYKEDALRRSQSCNDLSNIAQKQLTSTFTPLQQAPEFCRPLDDAQTDDAPTTMRDSVLDIRANFTNCDRTEDDEAVCLTSCTANCTDPPGRAVVLCSTCCNQFCRVCWEKEHDLQKNAGHELNVYIKAFQDLDGTDIPCSVCDPSMSEKAKYICFHCNVNFCQTCFKLTHPELTIHHYIVKRPDIIPEQIYCSMCSPRKIATSVCSICKDCFCIRCLPKVPQHKCFKDPTWSKHFNGTASMDRRSIADIKIKKELINMMHLKKQLVQEIPKFALKKTTRGKTDLRDGDRVVFTEDEKNYTGTVRWVGKSKNKVSAMIGVDFDDPVGTGDGAYDGKRKFHTRDNHAGFIEPIYLIRECDYNPKASIDVLYGESVNGHGQVNGGLQNDLETDEIDLNLNQVHNGLGDDLQIYSERFSTDNLDPSSLEEQDVEPIRREPIIATVNVTNDPLPRSNNQQPIPKPRKKVAKNNKEYCQSLRIGDYVAYFHEVSGTLCRAVVKWVGVLPDSKGKDITVGVEFDEPIGSGTGKYREHRLFFAKMNYASLIPLAGLLRYEDICM